MDESGPSIFFSIRGYITPTVLFITVNLVIATIVLSSKTRRREDPEPNHRPGPTGLERVRSIGLFRFGSRDLPRPEPDNGQIHHQNPPSVLERVRSIKLFGSGSRDLPPPETHQADPEPEHYDMDHHFRRIQSESAASHPKPVMAEERGTLRKLASSLSWRARDTDVVRRRPVPARREEEEAAAAAAAEEEVDARADDFINRFRQQLNLQRLDSIKRYKEMLTRGR